MLRLLLLVALVVVGSWALLVVLARRLPPGILKDLAGFLPACATTARRLRRHPAVPRRAKIAVALAGLWVLSPVDLVPEFLPVVGPLDDVLVVALALRYAARCVPRQVLVDAWPANPLVIERLVGAPPISGRLRRDEVKGVPRSRVPPDTVVPRSARRRVARRARHGQPPG